MSGRRGLPALFYGIPFGPVWAPYQIQASASDALFPSEWTFDSDQVYVGLADGSSQAYLAITGKQPVNEFSSDGSGGSGHRFGDGGCYWRIVAGERDFCVFRCALWTRSGLPSAPSNIAIVGRVRRRAGRSR